MKRPGNEIEDANVQSISDVKVIFSGLASGQYDAAVVDLAVAKNYVDSGDYVMLDETLMDEKNYIITYEGNDELLEKVNAALEKFMASDRYVELCDPVWRKGAGRIVQGKIRKERDSNV